MELRYRLQDALYKDSLLAGMEGLRATPGLTAFLIGGGAVQVYAHSANLRRPTLDIDFLSKEPSRGALGKSWGRATVQNLEKRGLTGKKTKARTGTEVRVGNLDPPFFVHLDCYSPRFLERHRATIDRTYESRRVVPLEGTEEKIDIEAPEDVLAFKLRKLLWGLDGRYLTEGDASTVRLIAEGLIDDVQTGDLAGRLNRVMDQRNMRMEEIAREGSEQGQFLVEQFKQEKNLYDILLLIESHRQMKIFSDPRLIPATVKDLRNSA